MPGFELLAAIADERSRLVDEENREEATREGIPLGLWQSLSSAT